VLVKFWCYLFEFEGVFQAVIAGTESKENLQEVCNILKSTNNPQVRLSTMKMTV
jgi:hypothetical protein